MTEIAPGIHSLGHGKGGHAHAFLIDHGGELSLVDTLFETDGRLLFDAIRNSGCAAGPRWAPRLLASLVGRLTPAAASSVVRPCLATPVAPCDEHRPAKPS